MAAPLETTGGTQTCVISSVHTLATITTAGRYQLALDVNALAGGATPDILEVTVEYKVRSAGTTRQVDKHSLVGNQGNDVWLSKYYAPIHEIVFKLKQTQGTGRAIVWQVIEVG